MTADRSRGDTCTVGAELHPHGAGSPDDPGRPTADPTPPDPRDLYLDAARACILDVGWRRTTLTEVARRSGVSRMTIYRSWSDMRQLMGDLMTREWAGVVAAQVALDDRDLPGAPAVQRLVADVVGTVRTLRDNELFLRIVELDPELVLPYLFARRGRSQDMVLGLVADQVRTGQAAGEVRAGDPAVIARGIVLTMHGFTLSAHTMVDDAVALEQLDAELATVLTSSLTREVAA